LGKNQIKDIKAFGSSKFNELETLDLFDNQIEDISVLKSVPFKSIKKLDLSFNSLKSVEALFEEDFHFEELKFGGNDSLDYSKSIIKKIYDKYKIKYTFESLFE
jgi:Leucine-rich repeat (LRR) protein